MYLLPRTLKVFGSIDDQELDSLADCGLHGTWEPATGLRREAFDDTEDEKAEMLIIKQVSVLTSKTPDVHIVLRR